MEQKLIHPTNKRLIKIIVFVILSIAATFAIAWGTITVLSTVMPKTKESTNLTAEQQASNQAAKDMQAATTSESSGDTAAAIASYKEALANYQKAGDKANEEGVKLKLEYLESLK